MIFEKGIKYIAQNAEKGLCRLQKAPITERHPVLYVQSVGLCSILTEDETNSHFFEIQYYFDSRMMEAVK